MSSNSFGDNFRITTFGESHGPAIGVVVDGVRPGIEVDFDAIQHDLERRRPGTSRASSPRKEPDKLELLAGIFQGKTTGAPIAFMIRNRDQRPKHYEAIKDIFRPGHADFTWWHKFGIRDWRGGGRTSGRETAVRVAAGSLARQLLRGQGVSIVAHVVQVGDVRAQRFVAEHIENNLLRCADPEVSPDMEAAVEAARKDGDSLGGVVEVVANGVPAGWGDPVFQKLDAQLAAALMSIGAVKGVEIGAGFALAQRRGSASNDPITPQGFASNNMGGLLGGISNGAPIVARVAVKPTSSIRHEQNTVDIHNEAQTIRIQGRHDPCICPRLAPVAEAMMALVLCDAHLRQQAITSAPEGELDTLAELAYCDAELLRVLRRRAEFSSGETAKLHHSREDLCRRLGVDATHVNTLFELADRASDLLGEVETAIDPLVSRTRATKGNES